jgi:hypothetical protein
MEGVEGLAMEAGRVFGGRAEGFRIPRAVWRGYWRNDGILGGLVGGMGSVAGSYGWRGFWVGWKGAYGLRKLGMRGGEKSWRRGWGVELGRRRG